MTGFVDAFFKWAFLGLFTLSFGTYFVHHLILSLWYKTQNLKKRYPNSQWALVTGSSSGDEYLLPDSHSRSIDQTLMGNSRPCLTGIGKSIAMKLARQGLNVAMVALGDDLLNSSFEEIKAAFPKQQFRKVSTAGHGPAMAHLAHLNPNL